MEKLPKVSSLREAVTEVIKNNQQHGYPPNRFIPMISVSDQELPNVCVRLVTSNDALNSLYNAILKHLGLVTLEDFISHYGAQWGFSEEIIETAKERSKMFDQAAMRQRFGKN